MDIHDTRGSGDSWAYGPRSSRRGGKKISVPLIAALTATFLMLGTSLAFASVWTDQADYSPGSVVTISGDNSNGAGYLAGETVAVSVSGPNGYTASCEAVADDNGAWSCQVTLWDSELAVGEYTYTATGQTSGVSEIGTFTDATVNVRFATTGLPPGTSVTVTFSGTNPGGNLQSGSVTFAANGPSANIGFKDNTEVTCTFPPTIIVGSNTYNLISSGCPLKSTGAGGTPTPVVTVTGNYALAVTDTTPPSVTIISVSGTGTTPSDTTAPFSVYTNNGTSIVWSANEAGSYAIKIGGTACSDATLVSSGTNLSGSYTSGNVTSSITNTGLGVDGSKTVRVCVTDTANNTGEASATVIKDTQAPNPPTASVSPAPNPAGWNKTQPVVVSYTDNGDNGLSDVASCTTPQTFTTETPASGTLTSGTCTDHAGNTSSATSVTVKIDLTDPSVAITSPATGLTTIATSISVSGTASDTPSGISTVTVNGTATDNAANWTTSSNVALDCGANTITATATDFAGRTATASITVTRLCFTLQYQQPIDQSTSTPIVNTGKYGRVIPVKVLVYLDGVAQSDTALAAYGLSLQMGVNSADCSGVASDSVEAYADAGASSGGTNLFRWDPVAMQWIYNLDTKAPPGVAMTVGSCYRLDVYVNDGTNKVKVSTSPYALFKPTK